MNTIASAPSSVMDEAERNGLEQRAPRAEAKDVLLGGSWSVEQGADDSGVVVEAETFNHLGVSGPCHGDALTHRLIEELAVQRKASLSVHPRWWQKEADEVGSAEAGGASRQALCSVRVHRRLKQRTEQGDHGASLSLGWRLGAEPFDHELSEELIRLLGGEQQLGAGEANLRVGDRREPGSEVRCLGAGGERVHRDHQRLRRLRRFFRFSRSFLTRGGFVERLSTDER